MQEDTSKRMPEPGDTMYTVKEHRYRIKGIAGVMFEYVVVRALVKEIRRMKNRRQEMLTIVEMPGINMMDYPYLSKVGKSYFFTREEAVELAERMTDEFEKKFGRITHEKLRRSWKVGQEP